MVALSVDHIDVTADAQYSDYKDLFNNDTRSATIAQDNFDITLNTSMPFSDDISDFFWAFRVIAVAEGSNSIEQDAYVQVNICYG